MKVGHVVIAGGSFAGFTAARALLDHAERVTIVERDTFAAAWAPRKGVPPELAAKADAWVKQGHRPRHTDPTRPPLLAA